MKIYLSLLATIEVYGDVAAAVAQCPDTTREDDPRLISAVEAVVREVQRRLRTLDVEIDQMRAEDLIVLDTKGQKR